ncbi:MAG: ORF6N domain-containing protein [Prevotellaceae bacterium]|nr:ORF6N domain-containing protein [Prevotellaceae bacterium]
MEIVKFSDVEDKVINIRGKNVILDSDVAVLYGVETKRVNEAVKNNPEKFPNGYVIELNNSEFYDLRSKFSTTNLEKTRSLPKAFTEKGLYMLATILKSPKATETTITIIEVFAKFRELSHNIAELSQSPDEFQQKRLMQKSGSIIADIFGEDLKATGSETSFELNFALFKVKHTVKRETETS